MDEFSLKKMRTWAQYKISCYCFCVWCESRESGGTESSRFPCVIPVVETSSDRVTFRITSNINDGSPLRKQPTGLTRSLCLQTSDRISNVDPTRGAVNVGVGGLQVHGIGSRRLVHKEKVEVRSNYEKSYFW